MPVTEYSNTFFSFTLAWCIVATHIFGADFYKPVVVDVVLWMWHHLMQCFERQFYLERDVLEQFYFERNVLEASWSLLLLLLLEKIVQ